MSTVYGPDLKPLGHPQTTRLIHQLWPDSDEDRQAREQREQNEAIVTRHIQKWFRETEGLR